VKEAKVDERPHDEALSSAHGPGQFASASAPVTSPCVEAEEVRPSGPEGAPGWLSCGIIHDWKSHWYTEKGFKEYLLRTAAFVRHFGNFSPAISRVIRQDQSNITIDIYTARPHRDRQERLRGRCPAQRAFRMTQKNCRSTSSRSSVRNWDAVLVAQSIAEQLGNRVSFRGNEAGAHQRHPLGAVACVYAAVAPGGAEMSRSEHYSEGKVPLQRCGQTSTTGPARRRTTSAASA